MTQILSPLISTSDLAAKLIADDVRVIDGSWWLDGRDAREDFLAAHIPGAVFLHMDEVSELASPLPHTIPSADQMASVLGAKGINHNDHVVVYDTQGLFSAARIRWLMKIFGANRVQVLDGGLPKWRAEGRALEQGPEQPRPVSTFEATRDDNAIVSLEDVRRLLGSRTQILDARGAARFNATAPEPRAGMRGGHMPHALNLPYGQLLNSDGTIKGGSELEAAFKEVGLDLDRPVITTCGSGVTAAILTLGLELLGKPSRLYDGSWSEWGSREDTPIET